MSDIATDIAAYLATQGYGTWKNANPALNTIFVDELQDLPANQIVVFNSGGKRPIHSSSSMTLRMYFDVHVRNTSKATARSKAMEILALLGNKAGIGGHQAIFVTSPVIEYFGKDDSNRHRYGLFFEAFD